MNIKTHTLKWKNLLSMDPIDSHLYIKDYLSDKEKLNELFDVSDRKSLDVELDSLLQLDALRRLENKTQVFAFKGDGKVRTRLTHSIDAMNVGSILGTSIANNLYNKYKKFVDTAKKNNNASNPFVRDANIAMKNIYYLPLVLRNAALIHDIGNPPFGHRGEDLITYWLEKNIQKYYIRKSDLKVERKEILSDNDDCPSFKAVLGDSYKDIFHFEGNAELLRVISKLSYLINKGISIGTLSACMKYTASYDDCIAGSSTYIGSHKLGYYKSESDLVNKIREKVGTNKRNPTAFLLEACDDIAYRLHDIDDCVKSGHITFAKFVETVNKSFNQEKELGGKAFASSKKAKQYRKLILLLCDMLKMEAHENEKTEDLNKRIVEKLRNTPSPHLSYGYEKIRSFLRLSIIESVADKFITNIDIIMSDSFNEELTKISDFSYIFTASEQIMRENIYDLYEVKSDEVSEYKIVSVLMDNLIKAVFNRIDAKSKPIDKIYKQFDIYSSKRFFEASQNEILSEVKSLEPTMMSDKDLQKYVYYKMRCVIDNIAGMTDDYALRVYKKMQAVID